MTAIDRSMVTIYIMDANVNPSTIASTDAIKGEITNWELSGGEKEVESMAAFGGFIDKEKPAAQFQLNLDVTPKIDANANRWDEYRYGSTLKSSGDGSAKSIFIQAYDADSSTYKTQAFNYCRAVTWTPNHNADETQGGTFTWKFSPETSLGVGNLQTSNVAASALPAWS